MSRRNDPNYVLPFDSNGPNGPSNPVCSLQVILDWLTTGNNFLKFAGNNTQGKKKIQYAKEICALIVAAGIKQIFVLVLVTVSSLTTLIIFTSLLSDSEDGVLSLNGLGRIEFLSFVNSPSHASF